MSAFAATPAQKPCPACGFTFQPGADWGFLGETVYYGTCEHINGERECESCSRLWFRAGNDNTHDYELVGDPPEYRGGCSKEDCPECVAEARAAGYAALDRLANEAGEVARAERGGAECHG